ncbi:hypothetical protein STANM309S_05338 [Streptomyces tanashiensis]
MGPGQEAAVGVERVEVEAGFDEAAGVVGDAEEDEGLTVADAAVEAAGGLGGFGGVLGDVGGDGLFGDVGAVAEGFDGADVELGAPAEAAGGLVASGGDGDGRVRVGGGGTDGVGEALGGGPRRRWRVRTVRAVDADGGVEMNGTPLLELGDLPVRDPGDRLQLPLREAGRGGDLPAEAVREPLPELPGVVVEEDGGGVVVRVGVERRAEGGVVFGVAGAAAAGPGAGAVVDRAEGRGGEGEEDAGVIADGGGDAPGAVSGEAGADEVVRVTRVGPGAGGAAGGPGGCRRRSGAARPARCRWSTGGGSRRWSCRG